MNLLPLPLESLPALCRARLMIRTAIAVACCSLCSSVPAVNPPPDGGYPGRNTAEGQDALFSNTTGTDNTAIGYQALFNNRSDYNTAIGAEALKENTTGVFNSAFGFRALFSNTTGTDNTAIGDYALYSNTTGGGNTATGLDALSSNGPGSGNTATGAGTLSRNTTGVFNTATGADALQSNTTGRDNTATGDGTLLSNTTGGNNTANGFQALFSNGTGNVNTANGVKALLKNTTGNKNTANGFQALAATTTGHDDVASGNGALQNNTTGAFNIAIGSNAGANVTTGTNNIHIGGPGVAGDTNTIRIGAPAKQNATYIAGIYAQTAASGVGVIIDSTGHLGTVQSSARFKEAIKPMDKASEAILSLQPVTFRYKNELDPNGVPQFGLIAEQVEKVNPDLVVRGEDGKATTVRYEAVNAMLLNEFLKEHRKVEEQQTKLGQQQGTIAALKSVMDKQQHFFAAKIAHQQLQIEALAATVQKVSNQLELNKTGQQVVANNQ